MTWRIFGVLCAAAILIGILAAIVTPERTMP